MFEDVFLGAAIVLFLLFTIGYIPLVLHMLFKRKERKLKLKTKELYSPRRRKNHYYEKHTIFHSLVEAMKEKEKKRQS